MNTIDYRCIQDCSHKLVKRYTSWIMHPRRGIHYDGRYHRVERRGCTTAVKSEPPRWHASKASSQSMCPHCGESLCIECEETPAGTAFHCGCIQCGYVWRSRIEDPARCPNCGSNRWRELRQSCRCGICEHEWTPRSGGRPPAVCPSCKSKDWNYVLVDDADEDSETARNGWIVEMYESGCGCMSIASESGIALFEVIRVVRFLTDDIEPSL